MSVTVTPERITIRLEADAPPVEVIWTLDVSADDLTWVPADEARVWEWGEE